MLTPAQLQQALYCCSQERDARHAGKVPGPQAWNDTLIEALARELAEMSSARQQSEGDQEQLKHETWISTRQVAEMIGWGMRKIQRHSDKLGGRDIGGRLAFPLSVIRQHVEGTAA
jgi:hypothetical protein